MLRPRRAVVTCRTLHAWKRSQHYSLYYSLTVVSLEMREPQVV
jgi:hypothetical protein